MFAYDGLGRLYYRHVPGMWWDYDGDRLTTEIDAATNTILRRWVHGPGVDEPLVQYEGSGTTSRYWLHADERGSIVAQSDSTGAATSVNRYDEYGAPASGNAGRFQYTGQVWLPEVGLYYYRARMYNPSIGRFMQTDPIGYEDGMNLYAYVGGDPVNLSDSSGTLTTCTGSIMPQKGCEGGAINGIHTIWVNPPVSAPASKDPTSGSEPGPPPCPAAPLPCPTSAAGDGKTVKPLPGEPPSLYLLSEPQRRNPRQPTPRPGLRPNLRPNLMGRRDPAGALSAFGKWLWDNLPWARSESIEEANRNIARDQRERDRRPPVTDGTRCLNCD